jgi:hypothetical protein
MRPARLVFLLSLALAAILGFGAGWWARASSEVSLEQRAHEAARHLQDAFRSLTR